MQPWLVVVFWWALFAGSHVWLTSVGLRPQLVRLMGPLGFAGFFSLVAFATFIPLCWYYLDHKHVGALVWNLSGVPGIRHIAMTLAALGITLSVAGFLQPSPLGATPGARPHPYGLTRITRHPGFMFLALWAIGHLLINGYASDVAFFGGFVVYILIGCRHQDHRKHVLEERRLGNFFRETSFFPFGAILSGRNKLVINELPWIAFAIGAAASGLAFWLHGVLLKPA